MAELMFSASSEWWYWGYPWAQDPWFSQLPPALRTQETTRATLVCVGVAGLVLASAAVWWLGRRDGRHGERELQWLLVGALASLVPLAGTIVLGRMTVAPAIAVNSLLAYAAWTAGNTAVHGTRLWTRICCAALVLAVVLVSVILPTQRSRAGAHYMRGATHAERRWVEDADFGFDSLADKHVFVLACRDMASQFSIAYIMHAAGRAMPASATLLSPMGENEQRLTRVDERTFELTFPSTRPRVEPINGSVYRSEKEPLRVGDRVASNLFEVSIRATNLGQPSQLRFSFHIPVDDPSLIFMIATDQGMARIVMPSPGETVLIPPAAGP
jgi:hypothetical protein